MRILFLLTYYYPHWTGLTRYAGRIAEGLAARGHDVHALAVQHDPDLPLEEEIGGVRVHRVPPRFSVSRSLIAPGLLPRFRRLLREEAIDAVSIHIPFPEVYPATALARQAGASVFLTHNGDLVLPAGPLKRPLEALYYQMTGAAGRLATGLIPQTRDYAASSRLLSPLWDKLHFIYAPVDLPPPDVAACAAWRRELGLEDRFLVGFAGRFVEEKGFDFLFQAVPQVLAARPDAHFVFAGVREISYEGFFERHRAEVEALADHFTFLGLLTEPQSLADFYGMIDCFALPSRSDCFPSTQIEAVRSGAPLVTADIPGAREIVRVTGMGVITRAGDPTALAAGILEVAERLPVYRARQTVALTLFDPERCFEAYEALFALSREQGGAALSAEAARRIPILARSADQVAPAVVTAVGADGLFRPPLDDAPDLPAAASPAPSVEAHHA
ncbi:MAG: glycosyltransferase family 4 protein [Ardenticatenia bacterium]|nr:glycosyltransferase family 4 protein [Ardenticatenia bacterium]